MIFDGLKFKKAPTVVAIREDGTPYLRFYRVIRPSRKKYEQVIRQSDVCQLAGYNWSVYPNEPVYAKPIPTKGHGLTNLAYGEDGRAYLAHDCECYSAKRR